ncbi:hypothetical protein RhiirA4_483676 [Rhizophagus irregularis]|uniref:Uncharacterized protein n=1 Tax=Rhizophagus irregularis TaxID=588596 RepID=A0A2I1HMW1_9GLOM|nr:hypothetical protein RhiirA4_483676 [Rhizophagus irregularis]
METRMLSIMSRADKEIDRNYSKLLYRTSSAINNALRMVYASKPTDESGESYENWLQMEKTMLNSRDPLLDALSYGNDIRRELALKNLSANCKKPANQRGVFGDKLTEMVHEEYELNKLFNEAAFQKNNFQNQTNFHLSLSNHPLRAPTRTKTGIFPLVHNYRSLEESRPSKINGNRFLERVGYRTLFKMGYDETIDITPSLDYISLLVTLRTCRESMSETTLGHVNLIFKCIAPKEYNISVAHSGYNGVIESNRRRKGVKKSNGSDRKQKGEIGHDER